MFCNKCGKKIAADSLFCSYCGTEQAEKGTLTAPDLTHSVPPEEPPAQSMRDRIVNNLILIFILLLIVALCYALSGNFIFEGLGTVIN